MSETSPPADSTAGHGKKNRALEYDVAETLYADVDEIARCPECGRETLWSDREQLPHAEDCGLA